MTRPRRLFGLLSAVGLLFGAACGDDDAAGTPATSEQANADSASVEVPDRFVVATSGLRGMSLFSSLEIAEGRGWPHLSELGVEVEVIGFGNGNDAMAALLGGDANVAIRAPGPFLAAAAQGEGLRALFTHYEGAGIALVGASKYEQERRQEVSDYDGGRWGVPSLAGIAVALSRAVAEQAGLDWNAQQVVNLGGAQGLLAGLTSDQADLVVMDPISTAAAIRNGAGYVIVNAASPEATAEIVGPQIGSIAVTQDSFASRYPAAVEAFVADIVEAMLYIVENVDDHEAILRAFPESVLEEVDTDAFETEWDLVRAGQAVSPLFDEELVQSTVDFYVSAGDLTQEQLDGIDLDQFFDPRYVEAALATLGVAATDFEP